MQNSLNLQHLVWHVDLTLCMQITWHHAMAAEYLALHDIPPATGLSEGSSSLSDSNIIMCLVLLLYRSTLISISGETFTGHLPFFYTTFIELEVITTGVKVGWKEGTGCKCWTMKSWIMGYLLWWVAKCFFSKHCSNMISTQKNLITIENYPQQNR